jgi:N utilization substance protein A
MERGNLVIDLGKTDALLPRNEIIPGENFKPGDRVQAILVDVVTTTKGPALYISRTNPKYLMKLFEQEVPEIRDGIIEIKQCSREPGSRAKMAVISKDRDIDPVGACVGMKGVRVQQVIQELKGEKIDIIPWSDNPMVFTRSALAPAEISSIRIDERNKSMEIMVEDTQLSLAIGKRGQNVRLAAQISGWKLDIISKTKLQKRVTDAITNLMMIEGMGETQARALAQVGVLNIRQFSETSIETILKVPGFEDREVAERFKTRAQALVDEGAPFVNGVQTVTTTITPENDAKAVASEKLKEMIQQAEGVASAGGTTE